MTEFVGTTGVDKADATDSVLSGFTGGTIADLIDANGDVFRGLEGDDAIESGAGIDTLYGGAGNDLLNGGAGSDELVGGIGDDSYEVDSLGDTIIEGTDEGTDSIFAVLTDYLAYSLASLPTVENLTVGALSEMDGVAAAGTGNDLDNVLTERCVGGVVTLSGGIGNDTFLGGYGQDLCYGGVGDDVYVFEEGIKGTGLAISVFENANEGIDTQLYVNLNFERADLADNVENLLLQDNRALGQFSGNSLDNLINVEIAQIYDTSVPALFNTIRGFAGNDKIVGSRLVDHISGDAGNDILDGGGGADEMSGGDDDDIFYVDDAGDKVIEASGGGNDRVAAQASFALDAGQEIELLTTTNSNAVRSIDIRGNELAQTIVGNNGNNWLHDGGVGGADTLAGRGGNDYYTVYNSLAVIIEGGGQGDLDRVAAGVDYTLGAGVAVESLRTTSQHATYAINLTGNEFSQQIIGSDGDNRIDGKGGSDTIQTGLGSDTVMFSTVLGAGNIDKIADFDVANDRIALDDAIFTALGLGALDASAFKDNFLSPRDADDHIIYNSNTGSLFYDADGLGGTAAIKFALLATGLALTAADFVVV
ncbi:calcium-binding protein [Mesorhizobium sp. ASY16-5R]|uniref:calcium-binding protein n=1 Tax=Mesorhizobium sp. ASY16-5R TaxID=3445772 RepID=UPI003F9FE4C0